MRADKPFAQWARLSKCVGWLGLAGICAALIFCACVADKRENSDTGMAWEVITAQINTERELLSGFSGDVTFRVSGRVGEDGPVFWRNAREELKEEEVLLRYRWSGSALFRVDVMHSDGKTVRSIVCDGEKIATGDDVLWPISSLHDAMISPSKQNEEFRAKTWPLSIIRMHLFPLSGGPGYMMDWKDYCRLYSITADKTSGAEADVRFKCSPGYWGDPGYDIAYTFDMSNRPRLTGRVVRKMQGDPWFLREWATECIEEFDGFENLEAQSEETMRVASRYSNSSGDDGAHVVTSILVSAQVADSTAQESQTFSIEKADVDG